MHLLQNTLRILHKLLSIFDKIVQPVRNLLAKLKILHQIFLIITVMIVFLVLEGSLTLNMLNRMQTITQKVFNESVQSRQALSVINQEVERIRKNYISGLLANRVALLNISSLESNYSSLEALKVPGIESNLSSIKQQITALKALETQPVNEANYDKLEQALTVISLDASNIEDRVNDNVFDTMLIGNQFSKSSRNITIIILIASLLISLILGFMVASLIVPPIKDMVHVVRLLSEGNLTETLNTKGNQEINQLVDGLNHAILNLKTLVSHITEQAQVLDNASKELSSSSSDSGRAASEVARAMSEMAKATADQTEQINQSSNNVMELGQLVRQVSKDTQNIKNASEHVARSAKDGQKLTKDVAQDIEEIYETTQTMNTVIQEMTESSKAIREFASTISGIAEQTTLLALNAAIEAARAGEHGKGFSVVAVETGKLAEQSKQASEKIRRLIAEMIKRNTQAVEVIKTGVAKVEAGKDLSNKATATFENIVQELEDTLNQIQHVASSAAQMGERNEQVINAVASVAAISQESMASTEEISATVQGQSAGAEEVAALADNLTSIADSLKESVATFKI